MIGKTEPFALKKRLFTLKMCQKNGENRKNHKYDKSVQIISFGVQ